MTRLTIDGVSLAAGRSCDQPGSSFHMQGTGSDPCRCSGTSNPSVVFFTSRHLTLQSGRPWVWMWLQGLFCP